MIATEAALLKPLLERVLNPLSGADGVSTLAASSDLSFTSPLVLPLLLPLSLSVLLLLLSLLLLLLLFEPASLKRALVMLRFLFLDEGVPVLVEHYRFMLRRSHSTGCCWCRWWCCSFGRGFRAALSLPIGPLICAISLDLSIFALVFALNPPSPPY